MPLVFAETAEGLIERFRTNDVNNDKWTIDEEGWESLLGWTPIQGRDVVDAAQHNTSIRTLDVRVVHQMTDEAVDVLSTILIHLHRVTRIDVGQEDVRDNPVLPDTLDRLLAALARCRSRSDVKHLDCSRFGRLSVSPRAILAFAQSFPNLENLAVGIPTGRGHHDDEDPDLFLPVFDSDWALAFGAVTGGRILTSLRRARVVALEPDPILPTLVSALHASSSLREIDLDIPTGADDLVWAAKFFCASNAVVDRVTVRGGRWSDGVTDLSDIFDVGPVASFSPTITKVEFFRCSFLEDETPNLVENAVTALQNVRSLRFGRCDFSSAARVLERLPHLTKLSCICREAVGDEYECVTRTGDDHDLDQSILVNNRCLEDLCRIVELERSRLNDIELDLIGYDNESFPAISRLMMACKGRLVLNLVELPWRVGTPLVEGARRLHTDLKDLRLRFVDCGLDDINYADIVQSFVPNKTLQHLELGFDPNTELDTAILSSAAIRSLIDSNKSLRSLSLRGLRVNGATDILVGIMPVLATTNRSLRAFELHGAEDLTEILPHARTLALEMLKENDMISTLVGFGITKGSPVDNLLLQNRYGRIFLRANDPNPIGIWATVLARVSRDQQIGIMYKFLRAKPGLVRRRRILRASATCTASSSFGDDGVVVVVGQKRRRSATE